MKHNQQDIEQFLFHEASLLDDGQLNDWLALYTQDSQYWIPCNNEHADPETHVSIIYENKVQLTDRIERLHSGLAYGQSPASKTLHMISNVAVTEQSDKLVYVRSHVIIAEIRRGRMSQYYAKCEHQLEPNGDGYKIKFKKTTLLNLNEPIGNLSFML